MCVMCVSLYIRWVISGLARHERGVSSAGCERWRYKGDLLLYYPGWKPQLGAQIKHSPLELWSICDIDTVMTQYSAPNIICHFHTSCRFLKCEIVLNNWGAIESAFSEYCVSINLFITVSMSKLGNSVDKTSSLVSVSRGDCWLVTSLVIRASSEGPHEGS